MAKDKVWFVFNEQRIKVSFDRELLAIGSAVYVFLRAGALPLFSHEAKPDFVPYCVVWIATSDWSIMLEDRLVVAEHDVFRITTVLGRDISKDDVRKALYYAAGQAPVRKLHLAETWHNSMPGKALAVAERLQLVSDLRRTEIEKVVWWHLEPLVTYLLLTCFDILGQAPGWTHFGNWLNSKKSGPDLSLLTSTNPVGVAEELHRQWLDQFGVRNSFYRFINEQLDQATRQGLLDSLQIKKYPLPPATGALSRESQIPATDDEKLRYLYKLRNSFTHEARGVPGKHPGVARKRERGLGQSIEGKLFKNFSATDWPDVLVNTVKFGLVTALRDQLSQVPQGLEVPDKLPSGPGRRSYA